MRGPRAARRPRDVLDIEPLLDRLENLERRYEAVGAPVAAAANASELNSRLEAQDAEIERLRVLVDVRAAEIEQRLEAEMEQRHRQALAAIERTVELKVSERIAAIERTLFEQSASIESLREHAEDTDSNLKRLIAAIEKLCERAAPPVASAAPPPGCPWTRGGSV